MAQVLLRPLHRLRQVLPGQVDQVRVQGAG